MSQQSNIYSVTTSINTKLNAIFISVTCRDNIKHAGYLGIYNALNPKHGRYHTELGQFCRKHNLTPNDWEYDTLATFSNYEDAAEYRSQALTFYGDARYVVLNSSNWNIAEAA